MFIPLAINIERWFKAVDTFMQMRPDDVHAP